MNTSRVSLTRQFQGRTRTALLLLAMAVALGAACAASAQGQPSGRPSLGAWAGASFGASPLGLELFGPRVRAVRPYLAGAAGILSFTRNTPEPEARRLNATFELGGGLRVDRGEHHALLLGWKFHHISNALTAPYDPGLDGNVVYPGIQRR